MKKIQRYCLHRYDNISTMEPDAEGDFVDYKVCEKFQKRVEQLEKVLQDALLRYPINIITENDINKVLESEP